MANPDLMLAVDRFQSHSPDAVVCDRDPKHGKMLMAGNINSIVCGLCGLNYPVSSEFLKAVTEFGK